MLGRPCTQSWKEDFDEQVQAALRVYGLDIDAPTLQTQLQVHLVQMSVRR